MEENAMKEGREIDIVGLLVLLWSKRKQIWNLQLKITALFYWRCFGYNRSIQYT